MLSSYFQIAGLLPAFIFFFSVFLLEVGSPQYQAIVDLVVEMWLLISVCLMTRVSLCSHNWLICMPFAV